MTDNLIFDLGGVIMDIDRSRAVEAFLQLGMKDANSFFDPYIQKGLFGLLEEGQISTSEFYEQVKSRFSHQVTNEEIMKGLNKFLIGIPAERLERLTSLRKSGHRVYLLSNTNKIMWNSFILNEFKKSGGNINDYFDGIVTSFEVGCCKPNPQIFKYAIKHFGIRPEETTFYDDSEVNIEGARKCGLHAELIFKGQDFMTLTQK